MKVQVQGREIHGIVDTAAQCSVVSEKMYGQLVRPPEIVEEVILKGAANENIRAHVIRDFKFKIGKRPFSWPVFVAPVSDDFIIGLDFLVHHKGIVNLHRNEVTLGEEVFGAVLQKSGDEGNDEDDSLGLLFGGGIGAEN